MVDANFRGAANLIAAQMYSTASYAARDLHGIVLGGTSTTARINLYGWDLSNQNLAAADLSYSSSSTANFVKANLAAADLSHSILNSAKFDNTDLVGANLSGSIVTNSSFAGASIVEANFRESYLTASQIYSTASYQAGDLHGIDISGGMGGTHPEANLIGWDLSNQNLAGAKLAFANMTNANLSGADLSGADFALSNLEGANFRNAYLAKASITAKSATNADFTGAMIVDARLAGSLSTLNFTARLATRQATYTASASRAATIQVGPITSVGTWPEKTLQAQTWPTAIGPVRNLMEPT